MQIWVALEVLPSAKAQSLSRAPGEDAGQHCHRGESRQPPPAPACRLKLSATPHRHPLSQSSTLQPKPHTAWECFPGSWPVALCRSAAGALRTQGLCRTGFCPRVQNTAQASTPSGSPALCHVCLLMAPAAHRSHSFTPKQYPSRVLPQVHKLLTSLSGKILHLCPCVFVHLVRTELCMYRAHRTHMTLPLCCTTD